MTFKKIYTIDDITDEHLIDFIHSSKYLMQESYNDSKKENKYIYDSDESISLEGDSS